ncbi:hypothetical protein HPP92_023372 [Vanilla planifolia]|uniref:Ninja-family protein n=1 Tax=Vanilla planifolia TaxID=51239 RepID=A0A835PZA4_VANPL|nr:hypothetical protein HPP92_023372 [Vanilla planifolia]
MVADAREGETEQSLSSRARDLLQGFSIGFSSGTMAEAGGGDSEDIELGLTLGGCFGSHRRENNGLVRFASIPAVLPRDLVTMEPLARTCSLPSETEEELMRRKELQILKRMEAKRKREERRNSKRTSERFEANLESWPVEKKRRMELENGTSWMSANGSAKEVLYNSGLPNWITADSRPATPLKNFTPASQGSAVSQGSSFSGGSESESRPRQGFETAGISGGSEIRSPPGF